MGKLFRSIRTVIVIIEIVGSLLSAIFFILEKIGVLKKLHKTQSSPSLPGKEK